MVKFGTTLVRCRHKTGLSQQQVADRLGVAKSTYHAWESDKSVFSAAYLPELANVFGIDLSDLFPPGLTITLRQPNAPGDDLTATFEARQLYGDQVGLLKQTITCWKQKTGCLRRNYCTRHHAPNHDHYQPRPAPFVDC